MGFYNILPELLLLVADNLSLIDLTNFRLTCSWVSKVINPHFQKFCLQDVGKLTVLQWAAIHGHAKLIELAISNGAEIDEPFLGIMTLPILGVRGNLYERNFRHPCALANIGIYYNGNKRNFRTPHQEKNHVASETSSGLSRLSRLERNLWDIVVTVHCVMLTDTSHSHGCSSAFQTQFSLTDANSSYRCRSHSYWC